MWTHCTCALTLLCCVVQFASLLGFVPTAGYPYVQFGLMVLLPIVFLTWYRSAVGMDREVWVKRHARSDACTRAV